LTLCLSGSVIEAQPTAETERPEASNEKPARAARKSRALPTHLRREVRTHLPEHTKCPCCDGELRRLGEDASEMLEYTPGSFHVIRHVRPKMSCRKCSCVVQAAAPDRVIDRGFPGPGLLAHVVTAKFCDHQPLYRQAQIFAREGVELDRSILARWVGEAAALLAPVAEVLRRYVLATEKLHGDDTPLPVLAPGTGKTKTGRFWTYVRDNRPAGDKAAPAVWFAYSPNRKGEHPQRHLAKFEGILQADAFAGFNKLYEGGAIQEAPCMAHYLESGVIWSDRGIVLAACCETVPSVSQLQIMLIVFGGRREALVMDALASRIRTLSRSVSKRRRARPVSFGGCW